MRTALIFVLMTMFHATQVLAEPPPAPNPAAVQLPALAPMPVPDEKAAPPPSIAAPAPAALSSTTPAPAVVVLPPAPPGQVYVPQASQNAQHALNDERLQIDQRLAELQVERARYGIGGPIAMMGVGFGGAFAFAYIAFIQYVSASQTRVAES